MLGFHHKGAKGGLIVKYRVMLLLVVLAIAVYCGTVEADAGQQEANIGYEYYRHQLNDVQEQVYALMLSLPPMTNSCTLTLTGDLDDVTESTIATYVYDACHAFDCDHPEEALWYHHIANIQYNAATHELTLSIATYPYYSQTDVNKTKAILDSIEAAADPTWDRFTKVEYIAETIASCMTYDDNLYSGTYSKANLQKQKVTGILSGIGVCESYTELFKALADRLGLPCVEVGSVGHAFVHIYMEDGKWYGMDPQTPFARLQGDALYQGELTDSGWQNIYELYDGTFATIQQPERTSGDYEYPYAEPEVAIVDVEAIRQQFNTGDPAYLYSVNEDGITCTVIGYTGMEQGDLVIPETIDGYQVSAIGNSAFAFCKYFTGRLILPDSVEVIEEEAFAHCTGLTGDLVLPTSLKTIKSSAFVNCKGFDGQIVFNDGLESIYSAAFSECSGFSGGLMLPDSLSEIQSNAFYGCRNLTGEIHIPNSIEVWNNTYIDECDRLSSFDLSNDHPSFSVRDGILYSKDMSTCIACLHGYSGQVFIPNGVEEINELAFYRCSQVTRITIPNTVKTIGRWAFGHMSGIVENINIPDSVETIGRNAFYNCNFEGTFIYPQADVAHEAFGWNQGITTLIIPNDIAELPVGCFATCTQLKNVVILSENINIGNSCFDGYEYVFYVYAGGTAEQYAQANKQRVSEIVYLQNGYALNRSMLQLSLIEADQHDSDALYIIDFTTNELITDDIIWTSSDDMVATVDQSGIVTAKSDGTVTISAIIPNLQEPLTCEIRVTDGVEYSADGKTLIKCSENYKGELVVPEGVTSIGDEAFSHCHNISNLVLPSTIKSVGFRSFDSYSGVVTLPYHFWENLEFVGNLAFTCINFELERGTIVYPLNASIEDLAFIMMNSNISTLVVPEGVERLLSNEFEYSCLTDVFLPSTITNIPSTCFHGNYNPLTIHGYSGYAEAYVNFMKNRYPDMNISFIPIETSVVQDETDLIVNPEGRSDAYPITVELCASLYLSGEPATFAEWRVDDEMVQVDANGIATIMHCGHTMVTGITEQGQELTWTLHCLQFPDELSLSMNQPFLNPGQTITIGKHYYPDICVMGPDNDITYSSSDPNIVSIDDSTITALLPGSTVITATTPNGLVAQMTVNVYEKPDSISLDGNSLTVTMPLETIELLCMPEGSKTVITSVEFVNGDVAYAYMDGYTWYIYKLTEAGNDTAIIRTACGLTLEVPVEVKNPIRISAVEEKELWAGLPNNDRSTIELRAEWDADAAFDRPTAFYWYPSDGNKASVSYTEGSNSCTVEVLDGGEVKIIAYTTFESGEFFSNEYVIYAHVPFTLNTDRLDYNVNNGTHYQFGLQVEDWSDLVNDKHVTWTINGSCVSFDPTDQSTLILNHGGLAYIVATTPEGYYARCVVQVEEWASRIWSDTVFVEPGQIENPLYRLHIEPSTANNWSFAETTYSDNCISYVEGCITGIAEGVSDFYVTESLTGIQVPIHVVVCHHNLIEEDYLPETCTESGHSQGAYCTKCDFRTNEIYPAIGHAYYLTGLDLATTDHDGWLGRIVCSYCGEMLHDSVVLHNNTTMTLPASIKVIEEEAFAGITAQQITIPYGASSIGTRAFANNLNLMVIVIPSSVTTIADDAFAGSPQVVIVCTPGSSAERYADTHSMCKWVNEQ